MKMNCFAIIIITNLTMLKIITGNVKLCPFMKCHWQRLSWKVAMVTVSEPQSNWSDEFIVSYFETFFRYPQCLFMLELLQSEHFRKELMNSQCTKFIDDQQLLHWQHYQRSRVRLLQEQAERVLAQGSQQATASVQQQQQQQSQLPLSQVQKQWHFRQ